MTYAAWGFDFAYGSGISAATLKANGCNFVCRYLSGSPGSGKDISAAEIKAYKAAGINIVFNWETGGQEVSEAQGVSDAKAAQAELNTLASQSGVPQVASTPVLFSLDTDPTSGVLPGAEAYMRGVASVLGHARTGGYGGYAWINDAFNKGLIAYGWQTYAWSNGAWDSRAQLQQYQNSVTVGPATVDRDRATTADYGQCKWSGAAAPAPAPAPSPSTPAATPTPSSEDSCMELKTGKGAVDAIRFPVWPSYLFFLTDVSGLNGGNPVTIRVALHNGAAKWDVKTVTLTAAAPSYIMKLPVDNANADGAVFTREDDGPVVAVSWR